MNSSINSHTSSPLGSASPNLSAGSPQWLVSVRVLSELVAALEFSVDIIDLKEPRAGALAPTTKDFWGEAAVAVRQSKTQPLLSAALGERAEMVRVAADLPAAFSFAKVGPSQCGTTGELRDLWHDAQNRLPSNVELVPVSYADFQNAATLPPESVLDLAVESGFRCCLIDTFAKEGKSTIDVLGWQRLERLSAQAQSNGLWCCLLYTSDAADE